MEENGLLPQKRELVHEKLAPNEVYLISKEKDTIIYVVNIRGTAHLKRASMEQ